MLNHKGNIQKINYNIKNIIFSPNPAGSNVNLIIVLAVIIYFVTKLITSSDNKKEYINWYIIIPLKNSEKKY